MKRLWITPQEKRLREMVNKFDSNNNGELEFSEFCEFLKNAKQGLVGEALKTELGEIAQARRGPLPFDRPDRLSRPAPPCPPRGAPLATAHDRC